LFRYPAKFHPPVVRSLIQQYTREGDLVLDPFCGSGTVMVEAAVSGRHSVGLDIDPVAVLVSKVKSHRYNMRSLRRSVDDTLALLATIARPPHEYRERMFRDLTETEYEAETGDLEDWIPPIPNLFHWFRRYAIIDLARIRASIERPGLPETHRDLLRVVFAAIIRLSSNADPVPVSGLEVTSHMKQRDKRGRLVDPFALFARAAERAVKACERFADRVSPEVRALATSGDATALARYVRREVNAVISSPPYHGAVDYYRRHQLEMYWLGLVASHADRLGLLHDYVGRPKVAKSHPFVAAGVLETKLADRWEKRIRRVSGERADAFRHYLVAMGRVFTGVEKVMAPGGHAVLVVGHSGWNNSRIPTTALFGEIAGAGFTLEDVRWYPVKNRSMSYARRNGANIDKEYVLVFSRR
jgi:DNA modification methylase